MSALCVFSSAVHPYSPVDEEDEVGGMEGRKEGREEVDFSGLLGS